MAWKPVFPYLYGPVLDAANGLPDKLRLRSSWFLPFGRQEKIGLALSARDLLPGRILNRPKFGRRGTVNLWQTPLTARIGEVFDDSIASARFGNSRDALAEWIDWSRLARMRLGKREQLFITLLLMTVNHGLSGYRATGGRYSA